MSGVADESPTPHLALVSLAIASLPNRDEISAGLQAEYQGFQPLPVPAAFDVLAAELGQSGAKLPRLVVLDALVRLGGRLNTPIVGPSDAAGNTSLDNLLVAAGKVGPSPPSHDHEPLPAPPSSGSTRPGPPPPSTAPASRTPPEPSMPPAPLAPIGPGVVLRTALEAIIDTPDLDHAWQTFAATASPVLCQAEEDKPGCDCSELLTINGLEARAVISQFETTVSVEDLKPYADPRNWPNCSTYFKEMKSRSLKTFGTDWNGVFEEHVELIPGFTLVTPLDFSYREQRDASNQATHVRLDYHLDDPNGTADITVDQGWIEMSTDTSRPMPTTVTIVKEIRFTNPILQAWTSLTCDTFWGELCIDTAMRCSNCQ